MNTQRDEFDASLHTMYMTKQQIAALTLLAQEYLYKGGNDPSIDATALEQALVALDKAEH